VSDGLIEERAAAVAGARWKDNLMSFCFFS
jgi:hypothetical protein